MGLFIMMVIGSAMVAALIEIISNKDFQKTDFQTIVPYTNKSALDQENGSGDIEYGALSLSTDEYTLAGKVYTNSEDFDIRSLVRIQFYQSLLVNDTISYKWVSAIRCSDRYNVQENETL